ncbi:hypothetical protein HZB90_00540 [archaeon]|nr:hypothetical protein [archaeon]
MKKRFDLLDGVVLSIIISTILAIFFPGRSLSDSVRTLLSVSSFLFGIFVAFSISDRHSRLKEIRTQLREGDALIFDIYKHSAVFGKKTQDMCRFLLDDWVIATIDYKLEDFHKARGKFIAVYDFVLSLKPSNNKQNIAYGKMLDIIKDMNKENKRMRYLVTDRISLSEWGSILALSGIILFCLFYINSGSLSSMVLTVLLSVTLTLLVLVLRDLDDLYWKEQKWIWDPLTDLFHELDLLPYFPDDVFIRRRIRLKPGLKYRVGRYAHPYPDMTDKTIEIVNG